MNYSIDKLLKKSPNLTHSEAKKVTSHVQRKDQDWIVNTLMLEGHDVPFRFKRKKKYRNLKGARVNLTYYPTVEQISGIDMDVMKVVRVRIS